MVGNLGFFKRVVAWEISSEADLDVMEREIQYYIPCFEIRSRDLNTVYYVLPDSPGTLFDGIGYFYVDLKHSRILRCISRDKFYKKFRRAF